MTALVDIFL